MKAIELEKALDKGKIHPLYFLHGDETYLIERVLQRIQSMCLAGKLKDFNYDLFLGGETAPDRIIDAAKTLPMMAPWRVVVVKDAHLFAPQQVKAFLPYCEKPTPTTCLILIGQKTGHWKGHLRMIEKEGRVVLFSHPPSHAVSRYIVTWTGEMGKTISPEAADVMGEMVGNNLSEVYQELDKLVSYVGERQEIGVDDVETVVSRVKAHTIFDLTEAMGMRNRTGALRILNQMVESGEPPVRILTMIVRQFRLIWMAKEMRSLGTGDSDIGKSLGIPSFFLQGFLAQLKNFTTRELATGYRRLFETDMALKSRNTSKKVLLENLVISLCH
ncbi:MAG: DNA polymerase III subunit delta [Proteobacteria bacterium]|nr:DNA polymerase III subunit delta [Pseudomonadota bacterium]